MNCPKCDSENVRIEGSTRSCRDCYHVWELEDDIEMDDTSKFSVPECLDTPVNRAIVEISKRKADDEKGE